MRSFAAVLPCFVATLLSATAVQGADEFYGEIERRPAQKVGTWVVGGKTVEVTANSRLEADHGPFVVGACVEVEHRNQIVIEMSTESRSLCKRKGS